MLPLTRERRALWSYVRAHGIAPGWRAGLAAGRVVPVRRPARIASRLGWRWLRWMHGTSAERKRLRRTVVRRVLIKRGTQRAG